ncbi:hypothetical protein [Nannocystis punicea]|uniref:Uncharacterized protein n=1 Tax=Nannocystis punicea TaxID=2995304 RepID=A0ABY7HB94_9BACT|nr:hypothetical protein [Nannocystis poenicansa]WAS96517.1 hypothetical protein O0S08_10200 [Nannocystis poenicansa]
MAESALSELVVWNDHPSGIFPEGEHFFPADRETLAALVAALRGDLAETHLVPVAELLDDLEEVRPEQRLPLRLTNLRAFLAAHHSRLVEALGHERVTANTLAHGARRIARLRELHAPDVIVDHDVAELARVGAERWKPQVDPCASLPDVLWTASIVDVDARRVRDIPLVVDADITDLVLLAAQCCIPPDATSLAAPWLEGLDWVSLSMSEEDDESDLPDDVVRVRPAINTDTVELLAFADVRGVPEAASLARGGALLRVHMVTSELDD